MLQGFETYSQFSFRNLCLVSLDWVSSALNAVRNAVLHRRCYAMLCCMLAAMMFAVYSCRFAPKSLVETSAECRDTALIIVTACRLFPIGLWHGFETLHVLYRAVGWHASILPDGCEHGVRCLGGLQLMYLATGCVRSCIGSAAVCALESWRNIRLVAKGNAQFIGVSTANWSGLHWPVTSYNCI